MIQVKLLADMSPSPAMIILFHFLKHPDDVFGIVKLRRPLGIFRPKLLMYVFGMKSGTIRKGVRVIRHAISTKVCSFKDP